MGVFRSIGPTNPTNPTNCVLSLFFLGFMLFSIRRHFNSSVRLCAVVLATVIHDRRSTARILLDASL